MYISPLWGGLVIGFILGIVVTIGIALHNAKDEDEE